MMTVNVVICNLYIMVATMTSIQRSNIAVCERSLCCKWTVAVKYVCLAVAR